MSQTVIVTRGHNFPANTPVTLAALRKGALPGISVTGAVATGDLAPGAVVPAKVTPGTYWYAAATFAAGVYSFTLDPALTAHAAGVVLAFKADAPNTGAVNIKPNGLAEMDLRKFGGAELELGDIKANQIVEARCNGTYYEMTSQLGTREQEYVATDSGTANAIVCVPTPAYASYAAAVGKLLAVKVATTNTGSTTLQINGLATPPTVKKFGNKNLDGGDLVATGIYYFVFDGTNWQLLNPSALQATKAWCLFNGVAVSKTITNAVDAATDRLTVNAHLITAATTLQNVQAVSARNSGGALPTGVAINTIYYAFVVDANTLTLHTSPQGGLDGTTDRVDVSANGTGTNTLDYIVVASQYNVAGVRQESNAGNLVDGDYTVVWRVAFASGSYVVLGSSKAAGASAQIVSIDQNDAGSAAQKRIQVHNDAGAAANNTEVHIVAFGLN